MLDKINSFLSSTTGVVVWNLASYVVARCHNSDTAWTPYRDKIEAVLGVSTSEDTASTDSTGTSESDS